MPITLKYIWQNVKEKKAMTALITLSLAVSGALLFVALSIGAVMDTVENDFESVTMVFALIFTVTCFTSVFVVYSSFKYIMTARIKIMGTFRSIGAEKKFCRRLLVSESAAYGLFAAILSVMLGAALLYILSGRLSGGRAEVKISAVNILTAALFCPLLSLLCAALPARAAGKYEVKEIILQTYTVAEKKSAPALITGLTCICAGVILPLIPALKYETAAISLALIFSLAGFTVCVGPLVRYTIALLGKMFPNVFALKNLRASRAHSNIAVLLAIAVAAVFMVASANAVLIEATDKSFALYAHDIRVSGAGLTDEAAERIKAFSGVTDAAGVYYKSETAAAPRIPIMNLYGMSAAKTAEFFRFTEEESVVTPPSAKRILISRDYAERENLRPGGVIGIGGAEFIISGLIREMHNSGNIAVIEEEDFKEIFGADGYTFIAVKSDSPERTAAALSGAFPDLQSVTISQMLIKVKSINADLFAVVDYIVILSAVAGLFGVLNNLSIAFYTGKRERALLRSVGMSRRQSAASLLAEAVITGVLGGILGLLGGILLASAVPAVMVVFEFPGTTVPISPMAALVSVLCPAAVCAGAGCLSALGDAKLDIIKTLREEII